MTTQDVIEQGAAGAGQPVGPAGPFESAPTHVVGATFTEPPPATVLAEQERSRGFVAFGLLTVVLVFVVGMLCLLGLHRLTVADVGGLTDRLLTPLIGLLGAATVYYFGKASSGD